MPGPMKGTSGLILKKAEQNSALKLMTLIHNKHLNFSIAYTISFKITNLQW